MNWEQILRIPPWSSLRSVAPAAEPISAGTYKVADHAYLLTQRYNQAFEKNHPEAPFVTAAIWAVSPQALLRFINIDATIPVEVGSRLPPRILLLGTNGKYGELQRQISANDRQCAERAVYSNLGAFVHKVIEVGRYSFCFLEPSIKKEHAAYAIQVALQ
jgi:hypothetical protein